MGVLESANIFGVQIRESANDGSDFSNAASDYRILFVGEDGLFHLKDSAGTVTSPTGMANPMTNVGDIIYGGTAGAPTRLADVATGSVLISGGVNTAPAWGYPVLQTADVNRTTDLAIGSSAYVDVITLSLGAGTWDVYAISDNQNGGANSTCYAAITDNSNTQFAQTHFIMPANVVTAVPVMAPSVAGSQTIKLRVFATAAGNALGSTSVGTGGGSHIHAVRIA